MCSKNFSGPSTRMEQDMILDMIKKLKEDHGLFLQYYCGDGNIIKYLVFFPFFKLILIL